LRFTELAKNRSERREEHVRPKYDPQNGLSAHVRVLRPVSGTKRRERVHPSLFFCFQQNVEEPVGASPRPSAPNRPQYNTQLAAQMRVLSPVSSLTLNS